MTDAEKLVELKECYDLVLKTARRCARDMAHAIDHLPADLRDLWVDRLRHYEMVLGGSSVLCSGIIGISRAWTSRQASCILFVACAGRSVQKTDRSTACE